MAPEKTTTWPGVFQAFDVTFRRLFAERNTTLTIVGLFALAGLPDIIAGQDQNGGPFQTLVSLVLLVAMPAFGLAIAAGKKMSFGEAMRATTVSSFFRVLFASILVGLAVLASVLLFIIPVIWVLPWVFLTIQFVVAENKGPFQAIKASKAVMTSRKGTVWGIVGLTIVISFALILLSFIPVVGAGAVGFYTIWLYGVSGLLYHSATSKDAVEAVAVENPAPAQVQ